MDCFGGSTSASRERSLSILWCLRTGCRRVSFWACLLLLAVGSSPDSTP
ncbi:hypothetical protein BRADI_1g33165v3 [Brachypodium distachyon]|uniref:Uncharacterized protein n=1 Tax=Brachypodium distachyon TaxID=15368 RepID=A0A2K2DMG7_BRADI|nr:hypothetical protein BRADI_1g33165v3 [Brachypodium distachyon]